MILDTQNEKAEIFYNNGLSVQELEALGSRFNGEDITFFEDILKELGFNHIRLLEIGCGTGRVGGALISSDTIDIASYLGLDLVEEYLDAFRSQYLELLMSGNYNLGKKDFLKILPREKYDCILLPFTVVSDFSDYQQLFRKISDNLVENGICIVDYNPVKVQVSNLADHDYSINTFNPDKVENAFNNFDIIKHFGYNCGDLEGKPKGYRREIIVLKNRTAQPTLHSHSHNLYS